MNLISKLFAKPKFALTATFHMKSGATLAVPCDDIYIKTDGNAITSYEITGLAQGSSFYIRIEDISAITYIKN